MFKRKLLKAIAANWILHSGGAVCRLAHFEYSTKYGMATCHEVVIREKSGLEVVNADKSAVFAAEPGGRVKCPSPRTYALNSGTVGVTPFLRMMLPYFAVSPEITTAYAFFARS